VARLKGLLKKLGLSLTTLALCFGLAECGFRLVLAGGPDRAEGDDAYPVYTVGGSSVLGQPYEPLNFPLMVEAMFDGHLGSRPIALLNLADHGESTYAQWVRLRRLLPFRDADQPGVVLVYAGHNDRVPPDGGQPAGFWGDLERGLSRRSVLVTEVMHALRRRSLGPPEYSAYGYDYYLRQIVELALDSGLTPILATVASNVTGIEPDVRFTADLPGVQQAMLEGEGLEGRGDWDEAFQFYEAQRDALAGAEAFFIFQQARCAREMGDPTRADDLYWQAVDVSPRDLFGRTTRPQNAIVRQTAADYGVPLADAVAAFAAASPDGFIGNELFADGHHPNLAGYRTLAAAFATRIAEVTGDEVRRRFESDEAVLDAIAEGSETDVVTALLKSGSWLLSVSVGHPWPRLRLQQAAERYSEALRMHPDSMSAWVGLAFSFAGNEGALTTPEAVDLIARMDGFHTSGFTIDGRATLDELIAYLAACELPERLGAEIRRTWALAAE